MQRCWPRDPVSDRHGPNNEQAADTALARELADASVVQCLRLGLFRGHASEDRYDAVDGVGYLLLALIYPQVGKKPDHLSFGI